MRQARCQERLQGAAACRPRHSMLLSLATLTLVMASSSAFAPLAFSRASVMHPRHRSVASSSSSFSRRGSATSRWHSNRVVADEEQSQEAQPPTDALTDLPATLAALDTHDYSYRDAIVRTLAWVSAAVTFGFGIWAYAGPEAGQEFFAGYLVEQSLSVDNLFVFLLLFDYFKVPLPYQDRVLNWGIYGAIVMRAIMIGAGAAALQQFHGILLVFAGILVYSSAKFFVGGGEDDEEDPASNSIVKFAHSLFPSTDDFDGDRFFTLENGLRKATPLFICMIAVEISDVVFAVDSIPAVFGVTENAMIVFTSNLFAIMGLRSLYIILSRAATDLKYLEPAVASVLGFIGAKMIAEYFGYIIPTALALSFVATLLGGGVGLSVWEKQKALEAEPASGSSTNAAPKE